MQFSHRNSRILKWGDGRNVKQVRLYIEGMACINCQYKIEKELRKQPEIESASVDYKNRTADISYNENGISTEQLIAVIDNLGYQASSGRSSGKKVLWNTIRELLIIAVLFLLLQYFGILNYLAPDSLADSGMGYEMLFLTGVITSVHCVAMCGGINLSQTLHRDNGTRNTSNVMFQNALAYNLGRIFSYTITGGILGAAGSLTGIAENLQTTAFFQGILKLLAGIIMVIMGINMLGLFPALRKLQFRIPLPGKKTAARTRTPFMVGLFYSAPSLPLCFRH